MGLRNRIDVLEEWAEHLEPYGSVPMDVIESMAEASGVPVARVEALWRERIGGRFATGDGLRGLAMALGDEPGYSPKPPDCNVDPPKA